MSESRAVLVLLSGRKQESDHYQLLQEETALAAGGRLVDDGTLAASVVAPANTGLAIEPLQAFWTEGQPIPLRSFTAPSAYPPA